MKPLQHLLRRQMCRCGEPFLPIVVSISIRQFMNMIDFMLLLVVVLGMWGGWQKGFILSAVDLLTLVLSAVAAFVGYPYLSRFLDHNYPLGSWTIPLSFIFILIFTRILLGVIFNQFLRALPPTAHRHEANRVLGIIPGFISGAINAVILAALFFALPINDTIS